MGYEIRDTKLKVTKALPAAASTAANSDGLDLGSGKHLEPVELLLKAPALSTTQLPDTRTCTYKIQTDNDAAFGSPTDLMPSVIVQTGAGGAGAAAAEYRFKLPVDAERYVRVVATTGVSTGDCHESSLTLEVLF